MAMYSEALFSDIEDPVGNWLSIGHPAVAELCAPGFDFVVIDTEHTDIGLESLANMLRAVESLDDSPTTFVRVPWNDRVEIKRILDLGPDGVIVPMVESEDEARRAVAATQYPPDGNRGVAPGRATDYGRSFDEYVEQGAEAVRTIVQIETRNGLEQSEEIAAVDGVDGVLVGQGDLSASLGVLGEWTSDTFQSALDTVIDAAHDAGKPVCMLAMNTEGIHRWKAAGADVIIAGIDATYLVNGSETARDEFDIAVSDNDNSN